MVGWAAASDGTPPMSISRGSSPQPAPKSISSGAPTAGKLPPGPLGGVGSAALGAGSDENPGCSATASESRAACGVCTDSPSGALPLASWPSATPSTASSASSAAVRPALAPIPCTTSSTDTSSSEWSASSKDFSTCSRRPSAASRNWLAAVFNVCSVLKPRLHKPLPHAPKAPALACSSATFSSSCGSSSGSGDTPYFSQMRL
mmetsp:Transcript_58938/g.170984  ORF Transcript_58938/g.170984 Transcript_58938/m.170984 type:complete len:204 (-) Transcript_58938:191-802(-)